MNPFITPVWMKYPHKLVQNPWCFQISSHIPIPKIHQGHPCPLGTLAHPPGHERPHRASLGSGEVPGGNVRRPLARQAARGGGCLGVEENYGKKKHGNYHICKKSLHFPGMNFSPFQVKVFYVHLEERVSFTLKPHRTGQWLLDKPWWFSSGMIADSRLAQQCQWCCTGWWFGTCGLFFHFLWGNVIIPTDSYFSDGV